ncbi:MAG: hypothetical protein ACJA1V_001208, partial [Flavobacteriaceae bacterium]
MPLSIIMFYTFRIINTYLMVKYILSLDQGTTSSRAIIFDKKGN